MRWLIALSVVCLCCGESDASVLYRSKVRIRGAAVVAAPAVAVEPTVVEVKPVVVAPRRSWITIRSRIR